MREGDAISGNVDVALFIYELEEIVDPLFCLHIMHKIIKIYLQAP